LKQVSHKRGNSIIKTKISRSFATEGTESPEVSGPKSEGQLQASGKAYLSIGEIFLYSSVTSVLLMFRIFVTFYLFAESWDAGAKGFQGPGARPARLES
jgi:hypothetical protein